MGMETVLAPHAEDGSRDKMVAPISSLKFSKLVKYTWSLRFGSGR
jgi:hypothetical protein